MFGEGFLKGKYNLQNSPEAAAAARRTAERTGREVSRDPEARIGNYLDRLRNAFYPSKLEGHDRFDRKERNLLMLKRSLYEQFVIKSEDIPDAYYESIKRRHAEEGRPIDEVPAAIKQELANTLIAEQKDSLDVWIDYLVSDDAKYPLELKYWAMRNVVKMGRYDKEKEKFTERYGGTVSPFPDLNQEALSLVFDAMEKKFKGQGYEFGYDIDAEVKKRFQAALQGENFPKLYGLAVQEFNPIPDKLLQIVEGTWVKYPKGSDPAPLVASLRRRGTGWCIAGEPTAKRYLQGGEGSDEGNDMEVFYSQDEEGNPVIPRVVIVSNEQSTISEVRGVAKQENLDNYIGDVVQAKLDTLPDGKAYGKRLADMKMMTELVEKQKEGTPLTREDLIFLYEIDSTIEGFGYQKDPRIAGLRKQRDVEKDMTLILECSAEQIAHHPQDINENTKVYLGPLQHGIFSLLVEHNVEHVYTSFPEGEVRWENIQVGIGGKDSETLLREMRERGVRINSYAESIMRNNEFRTLPYPKQIDLIGLTVKDLGFLSLSVTMAEVYKRAEELGLELCPAEVGPHYRLQHTGQSVNEWVHVAMEPIADQSGYPRVLNVGFDGNNLRLNAAWAKSSDLCLLNRKFLFRLPSRDSADFEADSRSPA